MKHSIPFFMQGTQQPRRKQRGISLIIVMIFMVILSGLAISVIQGSTFSARIAGNESDRTLAFQAAEAALKDAENDISSMLANGTLCPLNSTVCRAVPIYKGDDFDTDCPNGRCVTNAATPVWEVSTNWTNSAPADNAATVKGSVTYGFYTGATALPVVAKQPRYLLEHFLQGGFSVYRVTAVGYGANESSQAILQTAIKAM